MKKLILFSLPISILGIFIGSDDPILPFLQGTWVEPLFYSLNNGNSIVFNLSCGYVVSIFLWYILVYLPEVKKRKIIRENISQRYKSFKENTICNLLYAADSHSTDSNLVNELCDHNQFKEYFSGENIQRWYDALNGLDENGRYIRDIHIDLKLLYKDIEYVLNNIDFSEEGSHSLFVTLQENVFKAINYADCHYDHVKKLSAFLYTILASWSLVDGKMTEDIIQKMIDQI
ncbi:MAG: hypothetical protein KUA35_15700 [Pseudodesulfovibrio sp.]|uniref:Uncharacterized protein n=1 Tax=Pseudodesulfovibrio aespoeensis (strain ATCC 700646 / DSM 10631 / Aspo-2) TaxID=643562 RepID=E6W007_PSEA9|nr:MULTISPECIES: hypothetical protein [Pseudodesulfovibrio]MBU4191392.1 hypothetical protein [Pseudomonadota bacterium]ADU64089.1 hypothetical protein Daes_3097 [Pseudodesulfovibrio aespoeensis Aspo-2]MBU4243955.1 hypothetical protein [Pseudomonadota bacterium]MBU4474519.1 hypothetical protein [Pseudomonadota bacterium]MBU4517099.1 hypothetical protein [Pseudomonadota bacterium]